MAKSDHAELIDQAVTDRLEGLSADLVRYAGDAFIGGGEIERAIRYHRAGLHVDTALAILRGEDE
jgi:hypothetical protein